MFEFDTEQTEGKPVYQIHEFGVRDFTDLD